MRNTDERTAAVSKRLSSLKRQTRRRATLVFGAVCLLPVVGLALAMPGLAENIPAPAQGATGTASLFAAGGALGYLVIGLLAFALGIAVTILCFRLQKRDGDEKP